MSDSRALLAAKTKQGYYYKAHSHPLPGLNTGGSVCIQLLQEDLDPCDGDAVPRSYDVRVGTSTYQCNRQNIRYTTPQELPLNVDLDSADVSEMPTAQLKTPARQTCFWC